MRSLREDIPLGIGDMAARNRKPTTPPIIKPDRSSVLGDAEINRGILAHGAAASEWEHQNLYSALVTWADRMNQEFFDGELPPAAISIEPIRARAFATYQMHREGLGLKYRISFNTRHLPRPLGDTLTTLLHEMVHQWEEVERGSRPGGRHTVAFYRRARSLGIETRRRDGRRIRVLEGGRLACLLAKHGVEVPTLVQIYEPAPPSVPELKCALWRCPCRQEIFVQEHATVDAKCRRCGKHFSRVSVS